MKYDIDLIKSLCDGKRSSTDIAKIANCPAKYVQKLMLKYNLPRLRSGPLKGEKNPAWKGGRIIDKDGYVLVPAPENHPYARKATGKNIGRILEHRLMIENYLGRYLLPTEIVHHKDGNKLNNSLENLEIFQSNAEHLKKELTGKTPNWSEKGFHRMNMSRNDRKESQRVSIYAEKKKQGEIRKQQIVRARELLGKEHPCLSDMQRYLSEDKNCH